MKFISLDTKYHTFLATSVFEPLVNHKLNDRIRNQNQTCQYTFPQSKKAFFLHQLCTYFKHTFVLFWLSCLKNIERICEKATYRTCKTWTLDHTYHRFRIRLQNNFELLICHKVNPICYSISNNQRSESLIKPFDSLVMTNILKICCKRSILFIKLHFNFKSFHWIEKRCCNGGRSDWSCQVDHTYLCYDKIPVNQYCFN